MGNSNADSATRNEPESNNALSSVDAELQERLQYHYAEIEFLEEASAAVQDCLQHNCHPSGPGDKSEIMSDAGNVTHNDSDNNQHYYEEDFIGGEADTECYDDSQEEQFEAEESEYDDGDDNDRYHD